MLSAAVVVADGLGRGFDRAARAADLPDVIVRFDDEPRSLVTSASSHCPTSPATPPDGGDERRDRRRRRGHRRGDAVARGGRVRHAPRLRGRGRPRPAPDRQRGAGREGVRAGLGLRPGDTMYVGDLGPERVVGLVEAPDNVGFPLAKPRFYLARSALSPRFGSQRDPRVNYAEIWVRDPRYLNELLVQARSTSFGLHDIRFATRAGVRVLLDQAAGIVIDLLVALSVIALATAGAMLAASARAEVQRRLGTIGVQRAVGASGGHVTLTHALEAGLVAAPAAAVGCAAGVLAIAGPAGRLLTLLNEPRPGRALVPACWPAGWPRCAIAVAGAAWPAWRAAVAPGRRRCCAAPTSPRAPAVASPVCGAAADGTGRAGRAARRRPPRPADRHRDHPGAVGGVRAADAVARLRAERPADRSRGAGQALPAHRCPARARRAVGATDRRRAGGGPALRRPGGRLVLARGDDRRDRLSGRSHDLRGPAADGRAAAARIRRGGDRPGPGPGARAAARVRRSRWRSGRARSCACGWPASSARWITTVASPTSRPRRCCAPTRPPRRCWRSA